MDLDISIKSGLKLKSLYKMKENFKKIHIFEFNKIIMNLRNNDKVQTIILICYIPNSFEHSSVMILLGKTTKYNESKNDISFFV